MIRGISNLDPARSADCFSSSLSILGIILIVPAMRWESGQANMGLKELLLTKSISLRVVLTFRVVVSVLILLCLVTGFAIVMRWCGCEFPFWIYIFAATGYAIFLGLMGLLTVRISGSQTAGYLSSLGYWSLCEMKVITEKSLFWMFPVIKGQVEIYKVIVLIAVDILSISIFLYLSNRY